MNFEELTGGDLALVTGESCLNDKVKFNRMGRELISYHCALFLQVIASYMNLLGRDVSQVTDVLTIVVCRHITVHPLTVIVIKYSN